MVVTNGFGFFSDFALIHQWAGQIWHGVYVGQYPYPLMVLFAPVSLLPVDTAAIIWLSAMIVIIVLTLKKDSLYWIFFVPMLQVVFLNETKK